ANAVQIVHLEAVNQRTIGERRAGARNFAAVAPDERAFAFAEFLRKRSDYFPPRQRRTEQCAAERVKETKLDVRNDLGRDVLLGKSGNEFRQRPRRRAIGGGFQRLCFRHKISLTLTNFYGFVSGR
ncbi:MAG TPA: hypothetical protein VFS81_20945, partial [Candidatus Binatia bacterium]|nr:hypothetical protein [Candidatus Binatia bacterium]